MARDEPINEPDSIDEARAREEAARARRAAAESREADREREAERPPSPEPGARKPDDSSVVPADADEERTGVMRPPGGTETD